MKKIQELKQQLTSNDINRDLESAKVSLLDTNRSTDKQAVAKHPYNYNEVSQFDQGRKTHTRQRSTANQSVERLRRSENSEVRLNNRTTAAG